MEHHEVDNNPQEYIYRELSARNDMSDYNEHENIKSVIDESDMYERIN